MQEIGYHYQCSGCHACFNICPAHCIKMQTDEEGFLYPVIEQETCIQCGCCKSVCPVLKKYQGNPKGQAYACINQNEEIRAQSSSGGVFTLIAEAVIRQGGVVFGAAFDKDFSVHHIEVSKVSDLDILRGSKYLQSRIGDTYQRAKNYLDVGTLVLFSGTPCQISGLKSFLNKDYDNLIMQDIICHGVPSPKVWQEYICHQEAKAGAKLENVFFRHKKKGWRSFGLRLGFQNGKVYEEIFPNDLFMQSFLKNLCIRPSCYQCHSKSLERESDITLADFWGIEKVVPEMFDNKGTSLVLVNTGKGRKIMEDITAQIKYQEVSIDKSVEYNPSAFQSCCMPAKRKWFMKNINADNFEKCIKKCIKRSLARRVACRAKKIIKRVYQNVQK